MRYHDYSCLQPPRLLRRWNDLLQAARVCSGGSRDRKEDPGYITTISRRWEELTAAAVENF